MQLLFIVLILTLFIYKSDLVNITTSTIITEGSSAFLSKNEGKPYDVVIPIPARCMPEKQVIRLGPPSDPNQFYSPSCTRIERCGGCCTQDDLLSCQPVEKTIVYFQVTVSRYSREKRQAAIGRAIIPVEKHLKCKCDCIIKKENCTVLQEYRKTDCSCVCTNTDEKEKCDDDPINKSWDPHSCSCQCHEVKECPTGYLFNKHTCSCESQKTRTRYSGLTTYSTDSLLNYRRVIPKN